MSDRPDLYPVHGRHLVEFFSELRFCEKLEPNSAPDDIRQIPVWDGHPFLKLPLDVFLHICKFLGVMDFPNLRLVGSMAISNMMKHIPPLPLSEYITTYGRDGADRVGLQETETWHIAASLGDMKLMEAMLQKQPNNGPSVVVKQYVPGERRFRDAILPVSKMNFLADISSREMTAMHHAAKAGKDKVIVYLASVGVSADCFDVNGYRPLRYAVRGGHISTIKSLLKLKATNETSHVRGHTILHDAAMYGKLEIVQDRLDDGDDPVCKSSQHRTPMHLAACNGHVDIFKLLAKRFEEIHGRRLLASDLDHEMTYIAAAYGHDAMVEVLLSYGRQMVGPEGRSALVGAAKYGRTNVVRRLIPLFREHKKSRTVISALIEATRSGRSTEDCITVLLFEAERFLIIDRPLAMALLDNAAKSQRDDIVRYLIYSQPVRQEIDGTRHQEEREGRKSRLIAVLNRKDGQSLSKRVSILLQNMAYEDTNAPGRYWTADEAWCRLPRRRQISLSAPAPKAEGNLPSNSASEAPK